MTEAQVLSWIDQATGQIDQEFQRIPVELGRFPNVNSGEIIGRAIDFLRNAGVPITGHQFEIDLVLLAPEDSSIQEVVEVDMTWPQEKKDEVIQEKISDFQLRHNKRPRQDLRHSVKFFYDQSKLES